MEKILWLVSWYPNKLNHWSGDFIQRHARAAALYNQVFVFFVVKDESAIHTNDVLIETQQHGNLTEVIAFYHSLKTGVTPIDRILSLRKYFSVYKRLLREFVISQGRPKIVHVHVSMWAGVVARWFQRRYQVTYLVTEHWTGYDARSEESFYNRDFLFRVSNRSVFRSASLLLPVSTQLGQQINKKIASIPYIPVPNVVNTRFFNPGFAPSKTNRFIHVSSMAYQKNVPGLLVVFAKFLQRHHHWQLVMIGPADEATRFYANSLGLQHAVTWLGELSYEQVASEMQQATALVLFSRFENQPCVILEALCCGKPVIATNVGGIAEVINEGNGILVESEDGEALQEAMTQLAENLHRYDAASISRNATAGYNYDVVGKKISELYETYGSR